MTISEYNNAVKKWGPHLMRFINYSLRSMDITKDLTQDAFLVLWEKKDTVDQAKIKQFLFTVAYRKMLNHIKQTKLMDSLEEHHGTPEPANQEKFENRQAVEELVNKLPEVQRQILLLRDIEGYSYKEIQDIMMLNESQIKVYLFRARMMIREVINLRNNPPAITATES